MAGLLPGGRAADDRDADRKSWPPSFCDGAAFDPVALRAFCRARLTAYKVPRRIIRVTALPTSLIGKVLRRRVRDDIIAGGQE